MSKHKLHKEYYEKLKDAIRENDYCAAEEVINSGIVSLNCLDEEDCFAWIVPHVKISLSTAEWIRAAGNLTGAEIAIRHADHIYTYWMNARIKPYKDVMSFQTFKHGKDVVNFRLKTVVLEDDKGIEL